MLARMPGRCDRSSRRRLTRACALWLAVVLALAAAPVSAAVAAGFNEGGALGKLTEGQETETSTTSTAATTNKSSESGTSSTVLIVVVGAAAVLLAGVAFVIIRDARRVAPATDVDFAKGGASARHTEAALRRRRAKAKAARRQRKRNR